MKTDNNLAAENNATQTTARVALVTGAGKRLGQAIALALARQGWDIAVHFRHSQPEAEETVAAIIALGRRACALQADLSDEEQTKSLVPRAIAALGSLSCVVNNASLFEFDSASSFTTQHLDLHMHANLAAPVLLAQALHAATPDGAQSVVINLLDQKLANMNPDYFSYTLSKAALECATVMMAQSLAPKLRVVGLSPGITMISGQQNEEEFARAHRVAPLGYSSRPHDIAEAACYLAQASAITGTTLIVDGGQHLIPLQHDVAFVTKTVAPTFAPNPTKTTP